VSNTEHQPDQAFLTWQQDFSTRELAVQSRLSSGTPKDPPSYWVVIVNEDLQTPELRQCTSLAQVIDILKTVKRPQVALPFYGYLLRTTEGVGDTSLRYLLCPDGTLEPMFTAEAEVRLSPSPFFSGEAAPSVIRRREEQEETADRSDDESLDDPSATSEDADESQDSDDDSQLADEDPPRNSQRSGRNDSYETV
jgi:hypothetical protein